MSKTHYISPENVNFNELIELLTDDWKVALSDEAISRIENCRTYLDQKIKESDDPVYGINTGFGSLYKKSISKKDLEQLQTNLVMSHACGVGEAVSTEIVQLMLYLKIRSLSYGHSGVQLQTVQRLCDFFNEGVYPVVYEYGSLGASGDLAPLAHLSLPLLGLGKVIYENKLYESSEILKKFGWEPIHLKAKEGLALLNGTQFMSAWGVWSLHHAHKLSDWADLIGTLSLEAFDGRQEPFHQLIHQIRGQKGQIKTANTILKLLEGSEIINRPKKHVQDPYSFRCIPQVHGATKDAIEHVETIFVTEANGVTDNPNIFPEEDLIISGGNFHGQPLAINLDYLAIAVAELGSISERRTYQLISGLRELPDFLVANPGLNSGLMIPQYTAAALASRNKQLCSPASVDSIVSSNGQEDHVSMGANAAIRMKDLIENLYAILAIELITASQALFFKQPLKTSVSLEKVLGNFRQKVPFINNDRILHDDIEKAVTFLKNYSIQ